MSGTVNTRSFPVRLSSGPNGITSTLANQDDGAAELQPCINSLGDAVEVLVAIDANPLDIPELTRAHLSGCALVGAVSTFTGFTRRTSLTTREEVTHMTYEAYSCMAITALYAIARHICNTHKLIHQVVLVHRIGLVELAEPSVFIGIGCGHRREALSAVDYAIEELKRVVPIWKKEYFHSDA